MKNKNHYVGNYNVLNEDGIENNDNRTRIIKDRIVPHLKNEAAGLAAGTLGAGIGAGLGYATNKGMRAGRKYLMSSNFGNQLSKVLGKKGKDFAETLSKTQKGKYVAKNLKAPSKILFSDEFKKYRTIASAVGGAAMMAPKFKEVGKALDRAKRFEKEHMKSFGTQPNESEYLQSANLNPNKRSHQLAYNLFNTPDAMIKSKRRDVSLSGKINRDSIKADQEYGISPMYASTAPQYLITNPYNYGGTQRYASEFLLSNFEKTASIESKLKKSKKLVPAITGTLAGSAVGGSSAYLASKGIDDDDKNRKAKILLSGGAGALLGGTMGAKVGSNAVGIADGLYNKYKHPMKAFGKEINKFDRMTMDAYGDFIPKKFRDIINDKINANMNK